MRRGTCSICLHTRFLPFDTPNDPPFYPARDGEHHCRRCDRWLRTGSSWWAPWRAYKSWRERRDEKYLSWRQRWH